MNDLHGFVLFDAVQAYANAQVKNDRVQQLPPKNVTEHSEHEVIINSGADRTSTKTLARIWWRTELESMAAIQTETYEHAPSGGRSPARPPTSGTTPGDASFEVGGAKVFVTFASAAAAGYSLAVDSQALGSNGRTDTWSLVADATGDTIFTATMKVGLQESSARVGAMTEETRSR